MIAGVSGRLLTASFIETELDALAGHTAPSDDVIRALEGWSARREATFGPASSVRSIADGIALPLLKLLGYSVATRIDRHESVRVDASFCGRSILPVTVLGWDESLEGAWRQSVLEAVGTDERWSVVIT